MVMVDPRVPFVDLGSFLWWMQVYNPLTVGRGGPVAHGFSCLSKIGIIDFQESTLFGVASSSTPKRVALDQPPGHQ